MVFAVLVSTEIVTAIPQPSPDPAAMMDLWLAASSASVSSQK